MTALVGVRTPTYQVRSFINRGNQPKEISMKTKSLFILLCLLLFPYIVQAGDTPGTYTWYQFDPSLTGLTSVDYGITVKVDPGYRANVYWSNQFGLVGTG